MSKYCYHSPWCEDDEVCRCDAWREKEENECKREPWELFVVGVALVVMLLLGIYFSF